MRRTTDDYGFRALLHLAWPVVVARSSQAVIGLSDALMAAPLGEAPLAAVTTGSMNTFTTIILPMGVVFIAQSFASQLSGRGRTDVAVRYAWYALLLSLVALIMAVGSIPFIDDILDLVGYEGQVLVLMTGYLQIRALSVGAAVGTEALGNWYGGLGNTRLHMIAGLVAMVINVFLNWVLIYGNLGAPALGAHGAALASVIASWIGFATIFAAFLLRIAVPADSVRPRGLRLDEFGRMVRFGLPNGLNWFLEFSAFALFINVVVARLGTTVLAAMMVVININEVAFMPAFGVASAGAILAGQAIGRSEADRVPRILWRTAAVALSWQGSVALVYLLAPRPVMRVFAHGPEAEGLLEVGAVLLALSAAWHVFDAIGMSTSETLRAAGDTAWTMWARIIVAWLVFTPAAFLTVRLLEGGHIAAMLCVIGYLAILAVLLVWRFRSGAWKRIDLTGIESEGSTRIFD
jgi:MATE family multidrug resistance protein